MFTTVITCSRHLVDRHKHFPGEDRERKRLRQSVFGESSEAAPHPATRRLLQVKEEKAYEENVKFHGKVKAFSQRLRSNNEVIDLDVSDTEPMAQPVDILQMAEDAERYEATHAEHTLEMDVLDGVCSGDEAEAQLMFD